MHKIVEPWEAINYSSVERGSLYRNWADFATRLQRHDLALYYYERSILANKNDSKTFYKRSRCRRYIGDRAGAYEDAKLASEKNPRNIHYAIQTVRTLYELNQIEGAHSKLEDSLNIFSKTRQRSIFRGTKQALKQNLQDCLGDAIIPFILNMEKHMDDVKKSIEAERSRDDRPLWKIRQHMGVCDVTSIIEKEENILSPMEYAKRELRFKIFNQCYFNLTWIDVLFLKRLRRKKSNILSNMRNSRLILDSFIDEKYIVIKQFLKMLHVRSPYYYQRVRKFGNKENQKRQFEINTFRKQTAVRRNFKNILKTVRELRAAGNVERLVKYVEHAVGGYATLQSEHLCCWKFEFVNEIYNILALAFCEQYLVPIETIVNEKPANRVLVLLRIKTQGTKELAKPFSFGDRTAFVEENSAAREQKKLLLRLERRLYFVRYAIEHAYLLHEIGRQYLKQFRFEEAVGVARKAMEEAAACKSNIWEFLSSLIICKAYAILHKVEHARDAFRFSLKIAERLKNRKLIVFINVCLALIEEEATLKRRTQKDLKAKARGVESSISVHSQLSRVQPETSDYAD